MALLVTRAHIPCRDARAGLYSLGKLLNYFYSSLINDFYLFKLFSINFPRGLISFGHKILSDHAPFRESCLEAKESDIHGGDLEHALLAELRNSAV